MPIRTHRLDCGMTLATEPLDGVGSVALSWVIPLGSACDPDDQVGLSTLLSEMMLRGITGLTSRELSDTLDRMGVRRSTSVQPYHLRLGVTLLGERLMEALPVLTSIIRAPALPEESLDLARNLCLQSLESLNDDPQHLVMLRLRERHQFPPFNRHGYGSEAGLRNTTIESLRQAWQERCRPEQSILGIAGAFDPDAVTAALNDLLSGWSGSTVEPQRERDATRGVLHLDQDTSQVHISLAFDAPCERDEDSMIERAAIAVLSGGTSGRLFTEVRQRRSLCYSVGASYTAGRETGMVSLYAGTTPERAQETLDVCVAEIERMRSGVEPEEFRRALTGLKSRLIMSSESTGSRASSLVADQFKVGRPRSLDELAERIDAITIDDVNAYLARRSFGPYTLVTIGDRPLELSAAPASVQG